MSSKEFKLRRQEFLTRLGNNSAALIFAAKEHLRKGMECYPYRQHSDFYYLTGFTEPGAIAVFIPGRAAGEFVLFSREGDAIKDRWGGPCIGPERAREQFGAEQAFSSTMVNTMLPQLLVGKESIYWNVDCEEDIACWWRPTSQNKLVGVGDVLHEMRLQKSKEEQRLLHKAATITAAGFYRAMRNCRPGMYEFELEAELIYEFMRLGGNYAAFKTIVGSGVNACTLHYTKNTGKLASGDLVLIDAGAEYKYYCADVTRTFPVNRKFTKEQQAIYEAVLFTQVEVINHIRPGIKFNELQLIAAKTITALLLDLGLLQGSMDDLLSNQSYQAFFMHKIGHWLGLDVHDVGEYYPQGKERVLTTGMVLTVEPGIYITPNVIIERKWWNIGVRIEDDVLVTAHGCDVLTAMIPKTVGEIATAQKGY